MAENLLQPDGGNTPGGTTAADTTPGGLTPGAGTVNGTPTSNDSAPANPTVTGAGRTGSIPSGGSKAVPDDTSLLGSGTLGDDSSLDDAGDPQRHISGGDQAAQPAVPGTTGQSVGSGPRLTETDKDHSDDGGASTGGLSAGAGR